MTNVITSTALGLPLAVGAVLLVTAAMIAREVDAAPQVRAWTSAAGLALTLTAVLVMAARFVLLAQ